MRRAITLAAIGVVAAATTGLVATSALADESIGPGPATQVSATWSPGHGPGNGPGDGICDATCDGTPDRTAARDRTQARDGTQARDLTGDHDQVRDRLRDGSCVSTP